jgi:hypothetical protein
MPKSNHLGFDVRRPERTSRHGKIVRSVTGIPAEICRNNPPHAHRSRQRFFLQDFARRAAHFTKGNGAIRTLRFSRLYA